MRRCGAFHLVVLAVALVAAECPARGDEQPAAAASDPAGAVRPPAAIPITEIATRAESVAGHLRGLESSVASGPDLAALDGSLRGLHARIQARFDETIRALRAEPPLFGLDIMLESWQALRAEVVRAVDVLRARAETLEADVARLNRLRDAWTATEAAVRSADAPASVQGRVAGTLALLERVREDVAAERGRVLALLDRATEEQLRVDEAIGRIGAARRAVVSDVLVRDRAPLWHLVTRDGGLGGSFAQARAALAADLTLARGWVAERAIPLAAQLVAALVLAAALRRVRRDAGPWSAADPSLARTFAALDWPFACAVFLVFVAGEYRAPIEPPTVRQVVSLVVLAPVASIAFAVVPAPLRPAVLATVVFFLVDVVRAVTVVAPPLERVLFLAELAALGGMLAWLSRHLRHAAAGRPARWAQGGSTVLAGLAGLVALGLVAGVLGYMRLARLLDVGLLVGAYVALALLVLLQIAEALLAWALRVRPLRLLRVVHVHRPLVEARLRLALRAATVLAWTAIILARVGLLEPVVQVARVVLEAGYVRGGFRLSLGDVAAFGVAVWVATLASRFVRFVLEEDVFPRVSLARGLPTALSALVHYALLTAGLLAGFALLGLTVNQITIIASALGVGIGFGLQSIVNDFVSGLVLLLERPVKLGDSVQLGDLVGEVHSIGIRASTVRTWQGAEVIVPNSTLISQQVTNWTLPDRLVRVEIPVATVDDVDPVRVCDLLRTVAERHPAVLPDPPPDALFEGFGGDGLAFTLHAWTARAEGPFEMWKRVRSDLAVAMWQALAAAGIALADPVRELRISEVAPEAANVLRGTGARG